MSDRAESPPPSPDRSVTEILRLYEATGDTSAAATWRRELAAATSGPPSTPGR